MMSRRRILFLVLTMAAVAPVSVIGQSCEKLAQHSRPNVSVTTAETIHGGTLTPAKDAKALKGLPDFCRVSVTLRPTSDSEIRSEVWLPTSNWNGKFLAVGSGGWGGSIAYDGMADALRRGYATSATDDGHTGPSANFIVGHPEKFIDFAYRAEREMTVEAKKLVQEFYGRPPRYSYWNGCSGGGREGLLQAYRYPDEFDGIIAGDPANVRRNAWALWLATQTFKDPADYIPPSKYEMIHRYVLNACDEKDSVKDGLISDPESCKVDFKSLACKAEDGPECLTQRQVRTAQTIISPAIDAKGTVQFPRLEPGTELRWGRVAGGPEPAELFLDQFRYVVYHDPKWDWRAFDLERDSAKANAIDKDVDDLQSDLSAYAKRGGKILLYHGWADQQVAPGASVDLYRSILKSTANSSQPSDWLRLFMVPGMAHCSGGEGPDTFDKISVMEQWVEQGRAPEQIIASHRSDGKVDRTRPLCAYPKIARYKGTGSIDNAENFTCSQP
jgi:feruloyl esterase